MIIRVGQVDLLADQADLEVALAPALADAGVEHRRLAARIGADDEHGVGTIDAGDGRVENIRRPAEAGIELGAILAAIEVGRAERRHERPQGEHLLDRGEVAGNRSDALRLRRLHLAGNGGEGFAPSRGCQAAIAPDRAGRGAGSSGRPR